MQVPTGISTWHPQVLSDLQQARWYTGIQGPGHELALQAATHEPPEHTDVEPEQLLHVTPPVPHVVVDAVVTQVPPLQQPLQFDSEHVGPASCPPPPPESWVTAESSVVLDASDGSPPSSPAVASSLVGPSSLVSSTAMASLASSLLVISMPSLLAPSSLGPPLLPPCGPTSTDASGEPSEYAPRPVIAPQAATPSASKATGRASSRILQG
jgi:hypothetical protein